jgi:hypothetical protein
VSEPGHRASDAEREAVAERLRDAAAEGRLDPDELGDRVEAAYKAQTVAELEPLTADLPPLPEPAPRREPVLRNEHVRRRLAGFITPNLICIGVWLASGANGDFWPKWVLLVTGIALVGSVVHAALGIEEKDDDDDRVLPRPPRPPGLPR